jgi:hypothetical protein
LNNSDIENSIDIVTSILKGCKDNTVEKSTNKLAKTINEASCPEQALVMWAEVGLYPESSAYAKLVEDIYPMVKETIGQALLSAEEDPSFYERQVQNVLEKEKEAEDIESDYENECVDAKKDDLPKPPKPFLPSVHRFFSRSAMTNLKSIVAHDIDDIFGSLYSEDDKALSRVKFAAEKLEKLMEARKASDALI